VSPIPNFLLDLPQQRGAISLLLFNVVLAEILLSVGVKTSEVAARERHWMRIEMSAFDAADNRYSLTLPVVMGRAAAPA
jgi:hypothetical protein